MIWLLPERKIVRPQLGLLPSRQRGFLLNPFRFGAGGGTDPNFANVKHLLHFDGSDGSTTFTDQIGTTWTANGNAQIDTAQSKFGGASGLFDGTGDYVTATYNTTNDNWWTSDYTIEMWVYATSWATWETTIGQPVAIGNADPASPTIYWSFGPIASGFVQFYYYNGAAQFHAKSSGTISTSAWHHVAMTVASGTIKLWLDGTGDTAVSILGTPQSSTGTPLTIGQGNNRCLTGWIDDLRITKGTARYTANFTPPSAAFPNS